MSGEKLRMRTKLGFGIGSAADGAVLLAFNTWNFLFYNQVLGLSGTLAGLAVTISLLLDGITEPLVGSLSDRWRSKLGRRHPFLYAAPIPLAISFFLLFSPPAGLHGIPLFLWFTVFATLHRQALTLFQIPHLALGAELTQDYHQRSVVMSYATTLGVLAGAFTFFYGWTWFSHVPGGTASRHAYPGMALGVALVSALAIFASAFFTRDRVPYLTQPSGQAQRFSLREMLREIGSCLGNHNFRVTLLGTLFLSATTGVRETIHPYVSLFFWELPADKIRVFGLASPPAFILAFILTVSLHRRFEKRNTILGAIALLVFASALPIALRLLGSMPANGSAALTGVLMLFTFLFYGGYAVFLISILSVLADVADEHELLTGKRQEGIFVAARTFFTKLSTGLGHILAGAAIDLIHFPTHAKPGQIATATVNQLAITDGWIAAIPTVVAMFFYAQYRIDRHSLTEIQAQLTVRRSSIPPVSPSAIEEAAVAAREPAAI